LTWEICSEGCISSEDYCYQTVGTEPPQHFYRLSSPPDSSRAFRRSPFTRHQARRLAHLLYTTLLLDAPEAPAHLKLTTVLLEVEGFTDAPPLSAVVAAHHLAGDADHH